MFEIYKFFLTFTCIITLAVAATVTKDEPCPIRYKCSTDENIVWTTDGKNCVVHRNDCQLKNTNCQRQNRGEEQYKVVPKEECQKLCPMICTADYKPTCGEYNGKYREFGNSCGLSSHICQSGETYQLIAGPCPSADSQTK